MTSRNHIPKKIRKGIIFGLAVGLLFAVVAYVQAVLPGAVTNPIFGPLGDDVELRSCRWLTSNINTSVPSGANRPWLSFQEAYDNGATGICKCHASADPETAMTDVVGGGSATNFIGSLWTQTSETFLTCENVPSAACTTAYFTYVGCG